MNRKITHGSRPQALVVAEINGALCQCRHHESPHHKPHTVHSYRSSFEGRMTRTGYVAARVKLLPNGERSTGCRICGDRCRQFTQKKEVESA